MSQARHVNCKWQINTEKPRKDGRSKAEKFRSDKLAMEIPAGISKDELVKYFKKYGKVVASREINSQFIVQMEGHEPVDLAIELQAISEHEAKGVSFHVRRWDADEDEIRMWEEKSAMKRKADPPEIERPGVKSGKVAPIPAGSVLVENASVGEKKVSKGERNQFGHLPGCECKTCKQLGEELAKVQAKQELKNKPAADTSFVPPPPPEPAAVPDATEYNPFPEEEWVEPVASQNPFGHLQGCICPKCRKWAAGHSVEGIMFEEAVKQEAKQAASVAENFASQTQEMTSSSGNGAGYPTSGQGQGSMGMGMLTGAFQDDYFQDDEASQYAMSTLSTMTAMTSMISAMSAMTGPPAPAGPTGKNGHLPGCLCKTCRGGGLPPLIAPTPPMQTAPAPPKQQQKPPQPMALPQGKHLPGCLCPACRQG